jgi:hypothetical protein
MHRVNAPGVAGTADREPPTDPQAWTGHASQHQVVAQSDDAAIGIRSRSGPRSGLGLGGLPTGFTLGGAIFLGATSHWGQKRARHNGEASETLRGPCCEESVLVNDEVSARTVEIESS